jgi:competence protein ComEA
MAGQSVLWLRRIDQLVVACIVAACGLVIGTTVLWQIHLANRWIDIEREVAEPIHFGVHLNEAPWEELALLPGVGETTARNIIRFRTRHGPFTTLDELERVPGIGPKTLERLRPYLEPLSPETPNADPLSPASPAPEAHDR